MKLRLLRLSLGFSAVAWGVSVFGVFLPWTSVVRALQGMGAGSIPSDPMLDYWLRMASGAFFLVGVLFAGMAVFPKRFAEIIPAFGLLMLCEGAILLVHGIRLGLAPLPFYADTAACLLGGLAILATRRASFDAKR